MNNDQYHLQINYDKLNEEMLTFMEREWETSNKRVFGRKISSDELGSPLIITARSKNSNNEILGIASCKIIGNTIRVLQLLVKTEYRFRAGIGTTLLKKIETLCRKNDWHKIRLSTSEKHLTDEFYKKNGFFVEAELKNDAFGWTWYIYSKYVE